MPPIYYILALKTKKISEIVYENEKLMRTEAEISHELMRIWHTMLECMYIGCHLKGFTRRTQWPSGLIYIKILSIIQL
jgi:L-serine deaminase